MMIVLLVAGIGLLLAGLLTAGFGIELDLSFGNTLILAGAVMACSGVVMLGFWTVVRELRNIAQRLGPGIPAEAASGTQPASAAAILHEQGREQDGFPFGHDPRGTEHAGDPGGAAASATRPAAPWHEEARDRGRQEVPPPAEAAPEVKPRRNLLFSSSSRKERERAEARTTDPVATDPRAAPAVAPSPAKPSEPPPATFDDAWPQPERPRAAEAPPARRTARAPSTFPPANPGAAGADRYPPAPRQEEQPPVTVLKSGVVDGMAYSLYSDGSIEAQMPEGMMRFASIDELRTHLDQRP
jgi:hypothetical protein